MRLLPLLFLSVSLLARGDVVSVPNTFSNSNVADAAEVNENFEALVSESNENDSRIGTLEASVRRDDTDFNLAIGSGLQAVTPDPASDLVGSYNTAVGLGALDSNTTGYLNTAVGLNGLNTNSTGNFNSAFGNGALYSNESGSYNTAIGSRAAYANTGGSENTAVGREALLSNTTGSENTANGYLSLKSNTEGYRNTGTGASALFLNSTGYENTANGYRALYNNTTAERNTASGHRTLETNTTGYNNTATGALALFNNDTGYQNTAVGVYAMYDNNTGYRNTAIGFRADVTLGDLNNATAIGYGAEVDASNKVRIGNTSVTVIQGQVAFTSSSDSRLKDSITPVTDGLPLINDLNPVSYHRTNNPEGDIEMGLLAQEVEATLEKHGLGNSGMVHQPSEDSYMSLRYNDLLAPMIKAIQELDDASEAKDAEIASLQTQLQSQQEELLAIVQSQQEQITQLQQMVEHQFAAR